MVEYRSTASLACLLGVVLGAAAGVWAESGDNAGSRRKPQPDVPANVMNTRRPAPTTQQAPADAWPKLDADQQADAVKELKSFAEDAAMRLNYPLRLCETRYFLFYSDLPGNEAAHWAGLLDRMYGRLAELFGVARGENIWRGKGLVLVFAREDEYRRYERLVEHSYPGASIGMAHCFANGAVHVSFCRQEGELNFAHVLVHESVHGFVHRYRSPVTVPSWANEGLAEAVASELVPDPSRASGRPIAAREGLQAHGNSPGDFFTAEHIDGWQYPVAETLCQFMIRQNKKNYAEFINGVKDGQSWRESLNNNYKASLDRLLAAYGQSIGLKGLHP